MDIQKKANHMRRQFMTGALLLLTLLSSCSMFPTPQPEIIPFFETDENYPRAEVIFRVTPQKTF
jgi:hypothetical protein